MYVKLGWKRWDDHGPDTIKPHRYPRLIYYCYLAIQQGVDTAICNRNVNNTSITPANPTIAVGRQSYNEQKRLGQNCYFQQKCLHFPRERTIPRHLYGPCHLVCPVLHSVPQSAVWVLPLCLTSPHTHICVSCYFLLYLRVRDPADETLLIYLTSRETGKYNERTSLVRGAALSEEKVPRFEPREYIFLSSTVTHRATSKRWLVLQCVAVLLNIAWSPWLLVTPPVPPSLPRGLANSNFNIIAPGLFNKPPHRKARGRHGIRTYINWSRCASFGFLICIFVLHLPSAQDVGCFGAHGITLFAAVWYIIQVFR